MGVARYALGPDKQVARETLGVTNKEMYRESKFAGEEANESKRSRVPALLRETENFRG